MAQMKATDIRNKTSPYNGQNPSRLHMIFLAIYVLVTRGPVVPHCASMTNFIKHQFFFIPVYNQSQQAKGTELLNTVYYKDREIEHE